jgi:hypothetical protein
MCFYVDVFVTCVLIAGVMLTVPEGAIKRGHVEEIYMAVCRDDKDRPRLAGGCP